MLAAVLSGSAQGSVDDRQKACPLVQAMALDRGTQTLRSLAELQVASRQFGRDRRLAFAAARSGSGGVARAPQAVEKQLQRMLQAIRAGRLYPL